jgi:hypothetical protein
MPLPVAVGAAVAYTIAAARVAALLSAGAAAIDATMEGAGDDSMPAYRAYKTFKRYVGGGIDEIERDCLFWACASLGINIDLDEPLNAYTLTKAINTGVLAGTGIEFTNLLDGESIKRDMRRIAVNHMGESIGIKGAATTHDLVQGMKSYAVQKILTDKNALAALGIPANPAMLAIIARFGQPNSNDPIDLSEAGQSNRDRQAKYRASHSRHWEAR